MLWVLFLFLISSHSFAVFTNETLTITSFPNITKDNKHAFSSYYRNISADFPIYVSPGDKIIVYGTKNNSSFFVNSTDNIIIEKRRFPFLQKFSQWRITLSKNIIEYYPQSGSLVLALILGNRHFVDNDFMEYVRFSGLAHIMALSGLHLVIFVGLFLWLFKELGIVHRYLGIATIPLSMFYLFLGGFGISLQRAVLFHFLGSCYQSLRIPISSKTIFWIALLTNTMIAPENIFALSFWLSYISVLGIVFCYKFWYDILEKHLNNYIASSLAVSFAASTMVMPILIGFFGYTNILSVISSLIVMPIIPFVLILCFLVMFLSIFGLGIHSLDALIQILYTLILNIAKIFSSYGVVFFENKQLWTLVSLGIITIIITHQLHTRKGCDDVGAIQ